MSKIMLVEHTDPSEAQLIQESSVDGKDLYLNGIFMQANMVNRNRRFYPLDEISKAVNSVQPLIKNRQLMGSLDHPTDGSLTISLKDASHMIVSLEMKDSNAWGKAKLLPTPMGNIAKAILEGGGLLSMSSRGAGEVDNKGQVSDFHLVTIDLVCIPSAMDATMGVLRENLEMVKNGKIIKTLAEASQQDPRAQEYLKKEILEFFKTGLIKVRKD